MAQAPRLGIYQRKNFDPLRGALGAPQTSKNLKTALPFFGEVSRKSLRTDFFSFCAIQSQLTYIFCWDHKKRTEIQYKRYPDRQSWGIFRICIFKFLPYFLTILDYSASTCYRKFIENFWRPEVTGNRPEMGRKWAGNGSEMDQKGPNMRYISNIDNKPVDIE